MLKKFYWFQLVSDLLSFQDDYDRVCTALNEKENQIAELNLSQEAMVKKLYDQNEKMCQLQLKFYRRFHLMKIFTMSTKFLNIKK